VSDTRTRLIRGVSVLHSLILIFNHILQNIQLVMCKCRRGILAIMCVSYSICKICNWSTKFSHFQESLLNDPFGYESHVHSLGFSHSIYHLGPTFFCPYSFLAGLKLISYIAFPIINNTTLTFNYIAPNQFSFL